jgi:hypothetical protein
MGGGGVGGLDDPRIRISERKLRGIGNKMRVSPLSAELLKAEILYQTLYKNNKL